MLTLKNVRESKGWSQGDLALISGVNKTLISLYENGYALPPERHRLALIKALSFDEIEFRLKTPEEIFSKAKVLCRETNGHRGEEGISPHLTC